MRSRIPLESMTVVSSDPVTHVKKLRRLERLGANAICVMNVSGSDPEGIRAYRDQCFSSWIKDSSQGCWFGRL